MLWRLCAVCTDSFHRIDHSTLLWTVVGVNRNLGSGVPEGNVLGLLLFHLYTSQLIAILNNLIGYADDFTFLAVVPAP